MITLLKNSDYSETQWKNGKGKTLQISIFPPEAEVTKNNFLWRISSAKVTSSGPFSSFEGYERQLIVWKGEGLTLNNSALLPHSPITFSGEIPIQCELIGPEAVIDLGVIYKKNKVWAQLRVEKCSSNSILSLDLGLHFLFIAQAKECFINNLKVEEGDTVRVEHEESIQLQSDKQSQVTIFLISLKML